MGEEYDLTTNVIGSIQNVWQNEDTFDFTVNIGNEELKCHRAIIGASSQFFQSMFKTNPREINEGYVTLTGVSASTFQHILNSLYTGIFNVTVDTFLDIWISVVQLKIDCMTKQCEKYAKLNMSDENFLDIWKMANRTNTIYLINSCEKYAINAMSIDNFENIFKIARQLKSHTVVYATRKFMLKNFESIRHKATVMELQFNEFLELIESRDLEVRFEDFVLETVLTWAEYIPKETYSEDSSPTINIEIVSNDYKRQQQNTNEISDLIEYKDVIENRVGFITTLLKALRACLVSTTFLEHSLEHKLIVDNIEARDILIDAVLYKTTHYNHGQWPSAAIHRACSKLEHCGIVYVINYGLTIITAFNKKFYKCVKNINLSLDVTLVVFDSYLYATGVKDAAQANSSLYVFSRNAWNKITEIPGRQLVLVPYEQLLFILSKCSSEIYQIFPKWCNPNVEEFTKLPDTIKVQQAINYQRKILIFSSVTVNGEEKTAVYQLDISTKNLTVLEQLNGPAEQIISFSDDNNTYVLQTSGDLWVIDYKSGHVTFKWLGRLWNIKRKLHGALTYKQKLIIFGSHPMNVPADQHLVTKLEGYFDSIKYWGNDSPCSNFIPVVFPKKAMLPIE